MYIPDFLVHYIMYGDHTTIKIYCDAELRDGIIERFTEVFNEEYEKLMDLIEKEEGPCHEKEFNPFHGAKKTDYGVSLSFGNLALHDFTGDFLIWDTADEVLEDALWTIKKEYPSISYEGFVAYIRSDVKGGELIQYEIFSEKKKDKGDVVYDCIGEGLGVALEENWEDMSEELSYTEENDLKKIIKLFHMYSKWIPSDTIDKIIELSEESDKESLHEFADALRAGEDVDIEEEKIDTSDLPDGYMEAMEMFLMAQEISGNKPLKRGEILSSNGVFDIVIEKAESGDVEAKYTAGKYFIADHIEEEIERAIRWIREAAEAGLEEAKDYMEDYSELFE